MKPLIATLLLIFTGCGFIVKVPSLQPLNYKQQNDLSKFQEAQPTVIFKEVEKSYFDSLNESQVPFQVVLIATWCPRCYVGLTGGTFRKLTEQTRDSMRTYIVNTNDNFERWEKFDRALLPDTIYFLSESYGETERDKIFSITKQLCDTCKLNYAVPQYFKVNDM